ncbi:MAG: DUF4198 domain-containing protein [Paracoccaceae bacterium]
MTPKFTALWAAGALLMAQASFAHEILLNPSVSGDTLTMAIESTHTFVKAEELEEAANLAAMLVTPAGTEALAITQGGALSLQAVTPMKAGYFVAHRLPLVYSSTPDGFKPGGKVENPDAAFTNRYEKYSKALLPGADAAFAMAPLGHALELVPLSDPAALKAGDTLKVQVLHNGQPIAAEVQATFAGFSDVPMTFAYQTETGDEYGTPGVAEVKVWQSGYWYVRVAHDAEDADPGVDTHVLRAILSFDVK